MRARTSTRRFGCFIAMLLSPVAICAAAPPGAAETVFDPNVLDQEFAAVVRDNPTLQGAWIGVEYTPNVDEALPGTFTIRRVLDADRAAAQRSAIDRLVRSWLAGANYLIEGSADRVYPFFRLLNELELALETDPLLSGCQITGGYYAADPNDPTGLNLVLRGRIARDEQYEQIERVCGALMRRNRAWLKRGAGQPLAPGGVIPLAIVPKTNGMTARGTPELSVVEPSEGNGRWFYAAGLRQFWRLDYAGAARSFHQATLEWPRKLEYHYWWIAADLARGQPRLARRRIDMVVRRFRAEDFDHQTPEYRAVIRSLERVQGPLRQSLQRLETEALVGNSQLGANY